MNPWVRRFVAAPPRLQEVVELYQSLGFEVRLEKVEPDELPPGCGGCQAAVLMFRAVYTRKPWADSGSEGTLTPR